MRSQYGHESDLYGSVWDESGADRTLWISALDRRQSHHQATNIDAFRDNVLKSAHFDPGAIRNHEKHKENQLFFTIFSRVRAKMNEFQNATSKWVNIGRLVMRLASIESWDPQLSIGANLVSNGAF